MAGPYLVVQLGAEHAEMLYGVLDLEVVLPRIRQWVKLAEKIRATDVDFANLTYSGQLELYDSLDLYDDEDDVTTLEDEGSVIVDTKPDGQQAEEEYDHLKVYPDGDFWFEVVQKHASHAVESSLFSLRDFDHLDPGSAGWRP